MKKNSIKILDCTLRDGGYLNNWEFGQKTIGSIISNLAKSGIDYIECGFLKEDSYNPNKTFFFNIEDLEKIITPNQIYTLMVNLGEYDIKNFSRCHDKNIKIRVAFKKHNQSEAIDYIRKLRDLGWDVFANPMSTNTYSKLELKNLIMELNDIKPLGVTIVDTLGNMYENDVIDIFKSIDDILDKDIALGFHSHNSLQLSFSNAKALLNQNIERNLIIDSCLYGMGRGAGNLCTELIIKYLNDISGSNYKILPVLKSIEEDLKPIYKTSSWGYSTPYYIAAIHSCHPNYAAYLVKQNFSDEIIGKILSNIPEEKKLLYDESLVKDIANQIFSSV